MVNKSNCNKSVNMPPPARKHLTDVEKGLISGWIVCLYILKNIIYYFIGWRQEGVSQKECARRMKVHINTVKGLDRKMKKLMLGQVPKRKEGTGKVRKVTKEDVKVIKKSVEEDPHMTAKDLKIKHHQLRRLSNRTIRRILTRDLKLKSFVAAKKPFLSQSMKVKRLKFAKKFSHLKTGFWRKVVFSDEVMLVPSLGTRVSKFYINVFFLWFLYFSSKNSVRNVFALN